MTKNVCPSKSKWSFYTILSGNATGDIFRVTEQCKIVATMPSSDNIGHLPVDEKRSGGGSAQKWRRKMANTTA